MKRLDAIHWSLLAVVAVLAAILFLSPYRYDRWGSTMVRINRITGDVDRLTAGGWREMKPSGYVVDQRR